MFIIYVINVPLTIIVLLFLFCCGITCIFDLPSFTFTLDTGGRRCISIFFHIVPFSCHWTIWLWLYRSMSATLNRFIFFYFIYVEVIYRSILKDYQWVHNITLYIIRKCTVSNFSTLLLPSIYVWHAPIYSKNRLQPTYSRVKLKKNNISDIHNWPYPTLSISCMSLCVTVLQLLCINFLSLLSDGDILDTLCLLCCSSCFSPLSKDFLWVLLLATLCICDVIWLLLCTPPFCTFVSTELLLPPGK